MQGHGVPLQAPPQALNASVAMQAHGPIGVVCKAVLYAMPVLGRRRAVHHAHCVMLGHGVLLQAPPQALNASVAMLALGRLL